MDKETAKDPEEDPLQESLQSTQPPPQPLPPPLPTVVPSSSSPQPPEKPQQGDTSQPQSLPPPLPPPAKQAPSVSSSTPSPPLLPTSPPPQPPRESQPPLPQRRTPNPPPPFTTAASTSSAAALATSTVTPALSTTTANLLALQQRKTPLTPSFTQRKKMQRIGSEDQRWRTDLNLIQYMSRLKEQYMQRQTEHDLQQKRQKPAEDSFDSDTMQLLDQCTPMTKLPIVETADSVQSQGNIEDMKSLKAASVRAPQRSTTRQKGRSLIPIRSPPKSPPSEHDAVNPDQKPHPRTPQESDGKELPQAAVDPEDARAAVTKSAKPSLPDRSVREVTGTRKPVKKMKPRSSSLRNDVTATPVRPSKTGSSSSHQQQPVRTAQRRASSNSKGTGTDSNSKSRQRREMDTRMTGESVTNNDSLLKLTTETLSLTTQPLELAADLPIVLSSKESSTLSYANDHPKVSTLDSKSSLKAWPEDKREQQMVGLRNTFSMVKRGPPPVPPMRVFHTEERANRRCRKTRFSLGYYKPARSQAPRETVVEASLAKKEDKPAVETGSRNKSPGVDQEKERRPKPPVTPKTGSGSKNTGKNRGTDQTLLSSQSQHEGDVAGRNKVEILNDNTAKTRQSGVKKKVSPPFWEKKTVAKGTRPGLAGDTTKTKKPSPLTKRTPAPWSRKSEPSKDKGRTEAPTSPTKSVSNKVSRNRSSSPLQTSQKKKQRRRTNADWYEFDDGSDHHKNHSPEQESATHSQSSKRSPQRKPQTWAVGFSSGEKSTSPKKPAQKLQTSGTPRKKETPKTRQATSLLKRKSLPPRKPAPTPTKFRKQEGTRRSQSKEMKSFSPVSSRYSDPSYSSPPHSPSLSPDGRFTKATSQASPMPSRKYVTSPCRLSSRRQRPPPSKTAQTQAGRPKTALPQISKTKAVQVKRRSPSQIPVYISRRAASLTSDSPSPRCKPSKLPRLNKQREGSKSQTRDVAVQSEPDTSVSPIRDGHPRHFLAGCPPSESTVSQRDSMDDSLRVLNLLNDIHESPSEKFCDEYEYGYRFVKKFERSSRKPATIRWNRSQSNVRIHKHTNKDRTIGKRNKQQLTIRLRDCFSEEDQCKTDAELPSVIKLDRRPGGEGEWAGKPTVMASPLTSDNHSKAETSRGYDWSVIDVEESPPCTNVTSQKSPVLDAATTEKIEAELEEALTQLYKNQYQMALRVVKVKEDIKRLRDGFVDLQQSALPIRRPVQPDKGEGTLLDYLMLLGFMVVQIVGQFILVKM